jgi:tetratricopeptide (TPR) repeat protein
LTKAETAATAATAKLATETKKLHDEHAAEVKKLTDSYTAETKKLMDTYATSTTKLKDDHTAEVKKMADRFVADMKKLTETYETKVKTLESAVAEEKKAAEALAAKFKVDLGAAMSPAQALDVWLPLLTDLRRVSDADPALATATKVLSTAPNDSEDSAKARTVAGMAHFLKGDLTRARELFVSAQASPAYRAAAGKPWARAADVGLQSINDPLAPYRRPVEPRKTDPKAAARHLDAGMKAYKAGRFADAVAALRQSVTADPSDPLAWYYLGAAKWETAGAEDAKKEFVQGAEQERLSTLPTRTIGDLLAPIQGPARDALTAARP